MSRHTCHDLPHVEGDDEGPHERGGHVAGGDALRQSLHYRRLIGGAEGERERKREADWGVGSRCATTYNG